jgi:hypothetical protein
MEITSRTNTGKVLCEHRGRAMTATVVPRHEMPSVISQALWAAYGNCRSAAKSIARAADCTPRGAENLLSGKNSPNAYGLIGLMRESDEFCAAVLELAGRGDLAKKVELAAKVDAMLRLVNAEAAE